MKSIRIQIILFLVITSYTIGFGQDFNTYTNVVELESEKIELANLDSNPLIDIVYHDLFSVQISLNVGEDFNDLSSTEIYQSANVIRDIEIVDFDGDGDDDVVLLEEDYGALILLENVDSDNFEVEILIEFCQLRNFQTIDLDDDNDADIIGTNQADGDVAQNLLLYSQEEDQSFSLSNLHSKEDYFISDYVLPVDLDQDGDLDLLYHENTSFSSTGNFTNGEIFVFRRDEDGIFQKTSLMEFDQVIVDIQIADMNNDNRIDFVFTTKENETIFDIGFVAFQEDDFLFDLIGLTLEGQVINSDGVAFSLLDINKDGSLDIVCEAKGIWVMLNNGDKSFNSKVILVENPFFNDFIREFSVIDIDNDGLEDLLVSGNTTGKADVAKEWRWYKMTDRSTLTFKEQDFSYQEDEGEYSLWHVADLNADGYPDMIGDRGTSFIFENLFMSTSTNEVDNGDKSEMNIFPNPAGDFIKIEFGDSDINEVLIYNSHGQIVRKISNVSSKEIIDIKDLPSGVYYLRSLGLPEDRNADGCFIKLGRAW